MFISQQVYMENIQDVNIHLKRHPVISIPLLCKTPAHQFLLPYHIGKSCRRISQINPV